MTENTAPASIDLQATLREADIQPILDQLDSEYVGLEPVKTRIREIAALLLVDKARRQLGLNSTPPSLHMSFSGNPGAGKTTIARRMAEILHRMTYIEKPTVIEVTRDDLVGQYIGHTAPKTKEVLKRAMGGVLFIDEAYYLYKPENERDYGMEAIEILLQVMETHRDKLVVIFAGYKEAMEKFFRSNPGLSSRIAHHIDFPDYNLDELMDIGRLMLKEQQYAFSAEAETAFHSYLTRRMRQPNFANARSVRNALDRVRLRQARRLFHDSSGAVGIDQLMTIEASDLLGSRVFQGEKPEEPIMVHSLR